MTTTISAHQLQEMLSENPAIRVLDVRTGGEFETVHIPGSYNVPLDTLSEHARNVAAVDHPVVLVCQSGGRASKACDCLSDEGKGDLYLLEGGMGSWEAAGGEVVRGAERWAMDRQVRLVAGSLILLFSLLSLVKSPFKWGAALIGGGLTFSALTNTCGMAMALSKLPYNRTDACDVDLVLADMAKAA